MDSNGTESTEIEEDAQDDGDVKSPASDVSAEIKSPDIEITSPQSANSVRMRSVCFACPKSDLTDLGLHPQDRYRPPG